MGREDTPGPIEALLREAGKLESRDAQLLMREAYEQAYGIYDHERFSNARPLAVVAMHPKENTSAYSTLYRMFYKYQHLEILKRWGLTIGEFLSYPREYVELMFKIADEQIMKEAPQVERALKDIRELQKRGGG